MESKARAIHTAIPARVIGSEGLKVSPALNERISRSARRSTCYRYQASSGTSENRLTVGVSSAPSPSALLRNVAICARTSFRLL